MKKTIIAIISSLLPLIAMAQSHNDTIRLRQVVVTATQHATTRSEAPTAVGIVDGSQMEAANAVNLGQALNFSTEWRTPVKIAEPTRCASTVSDRPIRRFSSTADQ